MRNGREKPRGFSLTDISDELLKEFSDGELVLLLICRGLPEKKAKKIARTHYGRAGSDFDMPPPGSAEREELWEKVKARLRLEILRDE